MRGVLRGAGQRTLDHLSHLCIRNCSEPTRKILVSQPLNASLHKPAAPFADRVLMDAEACGNFLALQSLCTQQNYPASVGQRMWRFVAPDLSFEKSPILAAEHDQIRLSTDHHKRSCLPNKSIFNETYFSSR